MSLPKRWSTLTFYLVAILTVSNTASPQDSRACYFRDGGPAQDYVQCPGANGTKTAACCYSAGWPHIDPCFSNGFCFSTEVGVVYRGACTDQDWGSTQCVQNCQNVNRGGTAMLSFCQDLNLCCTAVDDSENRDCCSNGKLGDNKLNWNDPTLTGHVNASMLYDVYDSRQAIAGAVTESTSNGTVPTDREDSNTVSEGAIIGVGVGLGVPLLIALATCIWLFLSLRKERAKDRDSQEAHSYIETKHAHRGNDTSPGPSQNESASRVASHDPTIATQVAPGNLHPSMNGYAPETKNSNTCGRRRRRLCNRPLLLSYLTSEPQSKYNLRWWRSFDMLSHFDTYGKSWESAGVRPA
ncbi:hypothetical protein M409DRAFT_60612 [Zasmidium cellare ATCC 36951]|uniref:Mid2 domain-containing protein n=1 Tax=Zasmidium cellare ATCC 36951 TaxID=1080233 RepID=A0A6A6C2P7_ZASCE|nr:uncharacterized protein M409DRAFT_60612 [Zasmidium cellare ATCC 36951]KAF2159686.1 hypothetical protein M409DRAFT_60612 [Zasmidium cellare ATCC 36951]